MHLSNLTYPKVAQPIIDVNYNYYTESNYFYSTPNYLSSNLSNYYLNLSSNQSNSSIINVVQSTPIYNDTKNLDFTTIISDNELEFDKDFYANFPLFFINRNKIKIPSKVHRTIQRHIPKKLLKEIHKDVDVAIEMCLIFLTQLNSTYFGIKDESNPEGWKSLYSPYLRGLISIHPTAYKKVIEALKCPLNNGPILECDNEYKIGEKNHYYRLGKAFIGKGLVTYTLQTKEAVHVLNKHYYRQYATAMDNPICKNLIQLYAEIQLPTIEQIHKEAKRLIKCEGGYKNKKGKLLKYLNKHPREYFKDPKKYTFVEDAIEIFEYLTSNGLMIPTPGGINSGGRVVDSFTLMPSWIRNLIKINNRTLIECDYSALHPNIAMNLYGGNQSFLTHGDIQLELNIDVSIAKEEHLSFFNKTPWQMQQSPLFEYYQLKEPKMLNNIINEKLNTKEIIKKKDKHKITSRRLFAKEVEIMTDVITQLNKEGINVLYVYDAILCERKHAAKVVEVMDSCVLSHGVKTRAKVSSGRKFNPIVEQLKETKLDINNINLIPIIDANDIVRNSSEIQNIIDEHLIDNLTPIQILIDFNDGDKPLVDTVFKIESINSIRYLQLSNLNDYKGKKGLYRVF